MTSKGKEAVEPAVPAGWEFIHKVVSPLSYDDQHALANMLETVKSELASCLNPEMDKAEIIKSSYTKRPDLYKGMVKTLLPPGYEAKRRAGKTQTMRRGQLS
jgi:hypothetical protein